MKFSDVVGQHRIKQKLIDSIKIGRISHAQLFLGDSGFGSLALALAYAQYLNCESPTENDSCGVCGNCQKMYKLIHPDVHFSFPIVATKSGSSEEGDPKTAFYEQWRKYIHETVYPSYPEWIGKIGRENQQGNIPISEARSIIRKLSLKSYQGGYKVLIMWLPEFLGVEGNVLLKVLEEPTPKTIFLLVAEDESKILNTILSRCQITRIPRIDDEDLEKALVDLMGVDEERARLTAALSEGSLSRAMEILNSGENNFFDSFANWMRACFNHDFAGLLKWSNETANLGREHLKNFLIYSLGLLRESLFLKRGVDSLSRLKGDQLEWTKNRFAPNINEDGVIRIVSFINDAHYHIERNANPKIILYDLSLQISKNLRS